MLKRFHFDVDGDDNSDYRSLAKYESLLTAENLDVLACECTRLAKAIGFQHYIYGAHIRKPNGELFQYIFSGYPEKWMKKYLSAGYIHIDPIVEHCLLSDRTTPLIWNDDLFDTPARKKFMEDARGHGIASGLSIPLRGAANEVALFSGANPFDGPNCHIHAVQSVGAMYVMTSYLHEAIRNLVYSKEIVSDPSPELSHKEAECLHWWGDGKSAEDIGRIMAISPRTVRFHLDNVKIKLGVKTKGQAIARAYKLGILKP